MNNYWTKAFDQVDKVEIKSITGPLFRVGMIILIFGCITASVGRASEWVVIFLFALAGLVIFIGLGAYVYFAKYKPEYLRSEIHQQRMKVMELLGDKENANNPNVLQLPSITNPYIKPELDEGSKQSIEG